MTSPEDLAEKFDSGLEIGKYVQLAAPVGAGIGAIFAFEKNIFVGTLLTAYATLWIFMNSLGFVVVIRKRWNHLTTSTRR